MKATNLESAVTILSRENVRPSSPTPRHLRTYKLSMLDQVVPPMLVPIVLYFPTHPESLNKTDYQNVHHHDHDERLKNSLSLILTRFYPLAGRIGEDGRSIDCDGQGVPFVIAKFKGQNLSDLLKNPDPELCCSLLPCKVTLDAEIGPGGNVMTIQVTHFDCGGITLGVVFWHKAADATTAATVLNSWAATFCGSGESIQPNYVSQNLFPQKQQLGGHGTGSLGSLLKTGKSVMRRYVFNSSALSQLKASCTTALVERPTRVEVVSALLWKCFMAASLANGNSISLLTHAVNLRRRASPPFTSNCFGNFPGLAAASINNNQIEGNDEEEILGRLLKKMRDAIGKIDGDFVSRMLGEDGFLGYSENLGRIWGDIPEGADHLSISSWCNFGLYGVDFGWGKPAWVTRCDVGSDSDQTPFLNVIWLTDTRHGDGIEAWVILDEKYMEIFENVEELQRLACVDPSPLTMSSQWISKS